MTFPVVLATEAPGAFSEGATVGTRMAFDVFTIHVSVFANASEPNGSERRSNKRT